jgi:hypothetical protein
LAKSTITEMCAVQNLPMSACFWYSCSYGTMLDFKTGLLVPERTKTFAEGCGSNDTWLSTINAMPVGEMITEATFSVQEALPAFA